MSIIGIILIILYIRYSYKAVNDLVYSKYTLYGKSVMDIVMRKCLTGLLLGWILIPIWIIKSILSNR